MPAGMMGKLPPEFRMLGMQTHMAFEEIALEAVSMADRVVVMSRRPGRIKMIVGHAFVTIPTLLVYADGDCDIFPSEQRELLAKSAATDKQLVDLPWADHYLHPVGEEGRKLADPRERIIDLIVPWIEERIGTP